MRLKDIANRTSDLFHIDPAKIEVEPGFNVRIPGPEYDEKVRELANLIKVQGLRTPLGIRKVDDQVIVISGHTRLAAIRLLASEGHVIETVPCIPERPGTTELERDIGIYHDNKQNGLTMLETAELFARWQKRGLSIEQIAEQAGMSTKQVENILELRAAPQEVKELISAGKIAPTTAIKTMQAASTLIQAVQQMTDAVKLAEAAGKTKATPRMVEAAIAATKPTRPPSTPAPLPLPLPRPVVPTVPLPRATPQLAVNNGPRVTTARHQQFIDTMNEILKLNDLATIHQLVRDCLKE